MKKIISLALVLITILTLSVPAFAIDPSEDPTKDYGKTPIGNLGANPTAVYSLENEIINAQKIQEMQQARQKPGMATRVVYEVYCPVNVQQTNYWCGVASTLNLIEGNGYGHLVGSMKANHAWSYECYYGGCNSTASHYCGVKEYVGKQVKLDNEMGGVPFGGASWSQISSRANAYTPGFSYGYRRVAPTSTSEFASCLTQTIGGYQKVCMIWVNANELAHYPAGWYGHYINVYGYNTNTNQVKIADCNYSSYGGTYTESLSTTLWAMETSWDYNLLW